jgi:hypothetical protein
MMKRLRAYFRVHPRIHATIHWIAGSLGAIIELQDRLLGAAAVFPADSKWQHNVAYVLGVIAFSNVLVGRADKGLSPEAAAPVAPTSASEAITVVERNIDPEKSK